MSTLTQALRVLLLLPQGDRLWRQGGLSAADRGAPLCAERSVRLVRRARARVAVVRRNIPGRERRQGLVPADGRLDLLWQGLQQAQDAIARARQSMADGKNQLSPA